MSQPTPPPHTAQPYYIRRHKDFAVANQIQSHEQALYAAGEPVLFTLMWKEEDYEAGLVGHCARCYPTDGSFAADVASVYEQPVTAICPVCYGTTYGTGIRAQIIQPAMVSDSDEDERQSERGVLHVERVTIETTNVFRARTGDYAFRRDGSRWQLTAPTRTQLRTGYEHPTQTMTSIGYVLQASREDSSSVAYVIPPTAAQLASFLDVSGNQPPMTPAYQVLNGPLIPSTEFE